MNLGFRLQRTIFFLVGMLFSRSWPSHVICHAIHLCVVQKQSTLLYVTTCNNLISEGYDTRGSWEDDGDGDAQGGGDEGV